MAGATLTTVANILKEYYLPPITEQLNNTVLFLSRLESRSQELVGSKAIVPVHTARSGGIGAAFENGALPAAGNQAWARAQYDLKYPAYGRIRVTGPSMAKTQGTAGAFLETLKGEMDGIRTDLRRDAARQSYADGSGVIAVAGATGTITAGNAVTLSSAEPLRKGHIYVGMSLDAGTVANPVVGGTGLVVTDVIIATPAIKLASDVTMTSGTTQFGRTGSRTAAGGSAEMVGLANLVSTTTQTVGTIDETAAGNSYWANIRTNVNGNLTQDTMLQTLNQINLAGGDPEGVAIICTHGLQRIYFNLLQSQVRYTEPQTLKGGWRSLDFSGSPLIADRDCPQQTMFFLDEGQIKVFSPRDWHFLDEDGDILKWVIGFDAYEAVLTRYMNLGIKRRNTQAVLYNLTQDTTGY